MKPKFKSQLNCKYCSKEYVLRPDNIRINECLHSELSEYGYNHCNFIEDCYIRELLIKLEK